MAHKVRIPDVNKQNLDLVCSVQGGTTHKSQRRNALASPRIGYMNTRTGEFEYKPSDWNAFLMKNIKYIQAGSLIRVMIVKTHDDNSHDVLVHIPSPKSVEMGCDGCVTVHQPKNRRCSANSTPGYSALRDNADETVFSRWGKPGAVDHFHLTIKEHLRRRKVARGVLEPVALL